MPRERNDKLTTDNQDKIENREQLATENIDNEQKITHSVIIIKRR